MLLGICVSDFTEFYLYFQLFSPLFFDRCPPRVYVVPDEEAVFKSNPRSLHVVILFTIKVGMYPDICSLW